MHAKRMSTCLYLNRSSVPEVYFELSLAFFSARHFVFGPVEYRDDTAALPISLTKFVVLLRGVKRRYLDTSQPLLLYGNYRINYLSPPIGKTLERC